LQWLIATLAHKNRYKTHCREERRTTTTRSRDQMEARRQLVMDDSRGNSAIEGISAKEKQAA